MYHVNKNKEIHLCDTKDNHEAKHQRNPNINDNNPNNNKIKILFLQRQLFICDKMTIWYCFRIPCNSFDPLDQEILLFFDEGALQPNQKISLNP